MTTHRLLLSVILLTIPVLQAQPWPELGTSYDIAAFEPVSPAVPGPRETIFLGHGINDIPGQPSEPANFLGSGFAVADVNGDGKNDLIVASPKANVTGRNHAGSVWIWFGTGTTGMRDAAGLLGTAPNVRILGADMDDAMTWLGHGPDTNAVLATGDCTGDGIADLVLHSQEASGPGNARSRCGEAWLFFGRTTWPALIDLANPTPTAKADVVIYGESLDLLGQGTGGKMADLNGDNLAEVILFAPGRGDSSSRPDVGEVLLFPGRAAAAWPAVIDLAVAGSAGTRILAPLAFSGIKSGVGMNGGVGAADLNHDGLNVLFLTAGTLSATAARASCGGAYIIFGKATWPAFIDLETTTAAPHADVRIFGINQSDNLGTTGVILTGDCDGDGLRDLVLAADLADGPANARSGAGEAYLIWGRTTWPATLDLSVAGTVGCTIYGASAGGLSGDRLTRQSNNHDSTAIGDVNGDGRADLLLATPQGDGPNETRTAAGEVYLILGKPRASWPAEIDALPTTAMPHPDCIIYGQGPVPGSGTNADSLSEYGTLATGDVSGDGIDDILVGAPHRYLSIAYQPGASTSHGMAFIIKGRSGAWPATIDAALAAGTAGGPDTSFRGGAYSRLGLGGALGLGDLDNDGGLDVILGSPEYSYYPDGNLGAAYDPGDRRICGGLWAFAGATPSNAFAQAQAQLPTLAATMQFTVLGNGGVTFSYERDIVLATQVLYTAKGSPDLITWTPMPAPPQKLDLGNGFERVTHTYPPPVAGALFGQVVVTPLP